MTATNLRPGDANAPRNLRERFSNFIGRIRRWTGSWAVWLFAVVMVLMIAGLIRLWITVETVRLPLAILAIVFGWVGIYPVSYLAYWSGNRERKGRLEQDFLLLGLVTREDVYKVESLYRTVYSATQFIAYICLIVTVSSLILTGYLRRDALGQGVIKPETMALVFYSHLGAYVFAVQELIRRYNTSDLQPPVYSSILVRMLVGGLVTFVGASVILLGGGQLVGGASDGQTDPQAWAAVLAFVIGIFPTRGLQWFEQQANRVLNSPTDQSSARPLTRIIGISTWHEARLTEMGIDDAQNLATADIRRLLLTTQFDTQEIVHWIDQAILYVKAGDKIDRLREAKITTFHELQRALENPPRDLIAPAGSPPNDAGKARERLATLLGMVDEKEMERLADPGAFPNYAYIAQFYASNVSVAREYGLSGLATVIGVEEAARPTRERLEALARQNPNDPQIWLALGLLYFGDRQRLEEATQAFNNALNLDSRLAEAYYNRGIIFIIKKEYEKGIRDCTDALKLKPNYVKAYNSRGLAYLSLGYPDRALADVNKALALDDRDQDAYHSRGVVYNELGNFEAANADFGRAYLLGYSGVSLWLNWGTALIKLGQYEAALDRLSQAVQYEQEGDIAKAYARRGFAYLQLGEGNYRQARADLEKAISLDAQLLEAHSNLGLLEARLSNYDEAVKRYTVALKIDPNHVGTRYNMAIAYIRLERLQEAREQFESIMKLAPGSFEAEQLQYYLTSSEAGSPA
jgi:tetratricopeptide (TPR) repeat protein